MIEGRPNIVVVGVGHSGTSIVTRLLSLTGWNAPEVAGKHFYEHAGVVAANRYALSHGKLPDVRPLLASLQQQQPWAIKDPRFAITLPLWQPLLVPRPTVLWITKDLAAVKKSYVRRKEVIKGKAGIRWRGAKRGYLVEQLAKMVADVVGKWDGPVIKIDYADIAAAVAAFKPR